MRVTIRLVENPDATAVGALPRIGNRRLFVLVGIPGAGKTTYARAHLSGAVRISLDDIRLMLTGVAFSPRHESIVGAIANSALDIALTSSRRRGHDVVFDATCINRKWRGESIRRAIANGVQPHCVFFDVPLALALERNRARPQPVPDVAIVRFYRQLQPPSLDEGFVEVNVISQT